VTESRVDDDAGFGGGGASRTHSHSERTREGVSGTFLIKKIDG
jgi:hypothetical protein